MTVTMYGLGERIKELRIKRGYTQSSLGKKINKGKSAISSYETNAQIPPLDVLISLAAVLNVSLDYLAGFERDQTISLKDFSCEQSEIINMVCSEFLNPSNYGKELSTQQILILQKLILLFSNIPSDKINNNFD